jgi:hypothetical protein
MHVRADGLEDAASLVEPAAAAGMNVLVVDTLVEGHTLFRSSVREGQGLAAVAPRVEPEWWEGLIDAALGADLALVARLELLEAGATVAPFPRSPFARRRRWLACDKTGHPLTSDDARHSLWLAPWHPEVRDYLGALVAELCDTYPVDGLWLDAWRLPTALEPAVEVPPPARTVPLPSEGALGEDELQLDAELLEEPYDSDLSTPYEDCVAQLLRAVRARGKQGSRLPLVLLESEIPSLAQDRRFLSAGLAEGAVVPLSGSLEAGTVPPLIEGVTWVRPAEGGAMSTTSDEWPPICYAVSGLVISQAAIPPAGSLTTDVAARSDLPEFSAAACTAAAWECLQALQSELPQLDARLKELGIKEIPLPTERSPKATELLRRLVAELQRFAGSDEAGAAAPGPLLYRLLGYVYLLLNYHLI